MKKLSCILSFLFISLVSINATGNQQVSVESSVSKAIVYLKGAQIFRVAEASLPAGNTTIVLSGLPPQIDQQSIQAGGEGNFTILSVGYQTNYLGDQKVPVRIRQLRDSLTYLKTALQTHNDMLSVFKEEESLIISNKSLSGNQQAVTVGELKQMADFFRSRLTEIHREQQKEKGNIENINQDIQRISKQLQEWTSKINQPVGEIMLKVAASKATNAKININYFIQHAGWEPQYDLRATDLVAPVNLTYKARVYQSTGEDWNNISLTLSTGNPAMNNTKPNLFPWFIDFQRPPVTLSYGSGVKAESNVASAMDKEELPVRKAAVLSQKTRIKENQTSVSFIIETPVSVLSGNDETVRIKDYQLQAGFRYYAAPKLNPEAYLLSRITGWESLNLLSGNMNLFFNDNYVGEAYQNMNHVSDTLELSLGRDPAIRMQREKVKEYTSRQFIGNNIIKTISWKITVRNTRSEKINMLVEDQIPVSRNQDLIVEPEELSGGSLQKATGILRWNIELKPAETKELLFSYTVKYPKDKTVVIE
ncbi:MAG TPA: DUF4139 domain-containing protein [Bacteroidales bacterium]|nr:DUF4139 domain-containing protein [Bacteroidales bacterium]